MSFRPISLVGAKRTRSVTDNAVNMTTTVLPSVKKIGLYIIE